MLKLYTDGSCLGNPGPGGWAYVILDEQEQLIKQGKGHYKGGNTTNNRMEIVSVIKGLQNISVNNVEVYSDSSYVINTMNKGWKRNKNLDLWNILDKLVENKNISWIWVKAHNGNYGNELANKLAQEEANIAKIS